MTLDQYNTLAPVYHADHAWNRRAMSAPLGSTHGGLAVDAEGNLYCSTDGDRSVIVFSAEGEAVREFAPELAGIHALSICDDDPGQMLLATHLTRHCICGLTLGGEVLWRLEAPMQSGLYQSGSEFKPTAAVVAPDGALFVADGYGASVVHKYDAQRQYLFSFGGAEAGAGQLRNCHGLAVEVRSGDVRLLVCDRRNRRIVAFSTEGVFEGVVAEGLRRPCSLALGESVIAVAELEGRVSIFDRAYRPLGVLGDNPTVAHWANYDVRSSDWSDEHFNAPHAVCFDREGNLYVSEWNNEGRLTRWLLEGRAA